MKEIKFRAWDKLHKRLADVLRISFLSEKLLLEDLEDVWEININNSVLEQYTGLKDRNGKEIYEGDILKTRDFVFNDGNFIFLPVEYSKYAEWTLGMRRLNDVYKACEVVGNIRENADLLGVEIE